MIRYTPENSPRGMARRSTHRKEAQRGVKGQWLRRPIKSKHHLHTEINKLNSAFTVNKKQIKKCPKSKINRLKLSLSQTYDERFSSFTMGLMVEVLQPWGKRDIPAAFVSSEPSYKKVMQVKCEGHLLSYISNFWAIKNYKTVLKQMIGLHLWGATNQQYSENQIFLKGCQK